ncbi:uncharacterized protein LOC143266627 [Megachile rotundata]|uniref:uncharacterized protein LOC143266627 n=1 Tax=Megachile rotundata TaxID=143995 RepID=UPI003FD3C754
MLRNWQEKKDAIQIETIGQSKNPQWYMYKSKLLTASNFASVCRRRSGTLCGNLVKRLIYPKIINVPAIKYGQECEEIAREELKKYTGKGIKECGIFIDRSHSFIGASPDGIIDKEGIVEIKCPKTAENLLPEEAIKTIPSIRRIFENDVGTALNKTHQYYYQVQGQLHVTDRSYCIFCIWTRKGINCVTVERDDVFWKNQMEAN